jgi:hypothetical protein
LRQIGHGPRPDRRRDGPRLNLSLTCESPLHYSLRQSLDDPLVLGETSKSGGLPPNQVNMTPLPAAALPERRARAMQRHGRGRRPGPPPGPAEGVGDLAAIFAALRSPLGAGAGTPPLAAAIAVGKDLRIPPDPRAPPG